MFCVQWGQFSISTASQPVMCEEGVSFNISRELMMTAQVGGRAWEETRGVMVLLLPFCFILLHSFAYRCRCAAVPPAVEVQSHMPDDALQLSFGSTPLFSVPATAVAPVRLPFSCYQLCASTFTRCCSSFPPSHNAIKTSFLFLSLRLCDCMQDSSSLYEGDVTVECDDVIDAIGVSVDGPLAVTYMAAAGISTEEEPWPPAAARTVDIEITIRASCCRFV